MAFTARQWSLAIATVVAAFPCAMLHAQDHAAGPPANLERIRSLAGALAGECFASVVRADTPRVQVSVLPRETGWIIEDDVVSALRRQGVSIVFSDADYTAEFGIVRLQVKYENIRREWMFGSRIVDRSVVVSLRAKITNQRVASVLLSADMTKERRDTILVSDIDGLETSTLSATKGVIPPEGFFSGVAEPLIFLGTVAVAVVLLFTVRS